MMEIRVLPTQKQKAIDILKEVLDSTPLSDGIFVYREQGEQGWMCITVTDSEYEALGWGLFQTMQALLQEEQEKIQ